MVSKKIFGIKKKEVSTPTYSCIVASEESGSIDSDYKPYCPQHKVMPKKRVKSYALLCGLPFGCNEYIKQFIV